MAEPDVLLDGEVGDQRQFLEHGGDAARLRGVRIGRAIVLAIDEDRAAVMAHGARQDLDEGAFPGAVLAEQRMHLAGAGTEFSLAQRDDAAIAFRQAVDGDKVHEISIAWIAKRLPALLCREVRSDQAGLLGAGSFRRGDLDPVGRDRQRQARRLVGEGILADRDV